MIITIVGGGSTFTPGIVKSVLLREKDLELTEVRLFDIDEERQNKVAVVVEYIMKELGSKVKLTTTTDKETAYKDAKFIFAQMRVGKYAMREMDEKIPMKYGCVGQETCGCGGLAYGLRTIFPMMEVIDDVEKYADKEHWILNYSNPAAVVSEACRVLRPNARIINICDMPIAILDMISQCLGNVDYLKMDYKYFGLNHFGWFTEITYEGRDIIKETRDYVNEVGTLMPRKHIEKLKEVLAKDTRHASQSWVKVWKNMKTMMDLYPNYLPNTYLQYYLLSKDVAENSNPDWTRANEVMASREKNLFEGVDHYLKTGEITKDAFYHGAHGNFIADLAVSIKNDLKEKFIIIEANNGNIPNIDDDVMVELPAYMGKNGPEVIKIDAIPTFHKGLMEQQVASEKLIVEGAIEGSYNKVLQAFAMNKTVPSSLVAKEILDEMIESNKEFWPELK